MPAHYHSKDFIETAEGLMFAVVASGVEEDKVLGFLRYANTGGGWQKLDSPQANGLLAERHPGYLHYSPRLDAHLHAVPLTRIRNHHQPKQRLRHLLAQASPDPVEDDVRQLAHMLQAHGLELAAMGVTGSILIGLHNPGSDIDLVCYQPAVFQRCRALVKRLLDSGHLRPLAEDDWRQSYQRRSCALSLRDYIWHERRKLNKALVNGRKFDLSLVDEAMAPTAGAASHRKQGRIRLRCRVTDDRHGFCYPAEFTVEHGQIHSVVSFTATYAGQALRGELIEVAGVLEHTPDGLRVVVGSSREAPGEYIRVVRDG